ncbi:MAG: response regulator [Candidatus Aminicenantes bacterium]|nr:response regulator [Candidatus Aminicenantes bacterium]
MPYRIVVADPSPSVQKAVQAAFSESGFKLYVFEDGRELVDALPSIRPDTVILGLSLSGMDAFEVGRFLAGREESRNVPLFFLKGTFELFDPDRAADIPHDGVIQKPFDSEKLAATVREAIDRKISPPTMPEEPFPEAPSAEFPSKGLGESPSSSAPPDALRSTVREIVRTEVLEMERELEKRIAARVLAGLRK